MRDMKVKVYNKSKYEKDSVKVEELIYKDVDSYKVISAGNYSSEEVKELESQMGESDMDEYHEYLILKLNDGNTATFCNSHVDLFYL